MRIRDILRLMLPVLALVLLVGCGGGGSPAPETPDPEPEAAEPTGPVVPEQGVVRVRVLSRETLPSLNAPPTSPMTQEETYAAVQTGLVSLLGDRLAADDLHCEALPGTDRVRFWVLRGEGMDDARAAELAEQLASEFMESAELRFADRIEVALLGVGKQLEAASAQRAQAQQTLRDYLEVNRDRPATAETRRAQHELERDLHRINEHAGALQSLQAELEAARERGQRWYRRVE